MALSDLCERCATSLGHSYARFRRALDTGNPVVALAAARDLPTLGLADALELCLTLRGDPARFSLWAARWHSRYAAQARGLSAQESTAVLALLEAIGGPRPRPAARALAELLGETGHPEASKVLVRWVAD